MFEGFYSAYFLSDKPVQSYLSLLTRFSKKLSEKVSKKCLIFSETSFAINHGQFANKYEQ